MRRGGAGVDRDPQVHPPGHRPTGPDARRGPRSPRRCVPSGTRTRSPRQGATTVARSPQACCGPLGASPRTLLRRRETPVTRCLSRTTCARVLAGQNAEAVCKRLPKRYNHTHCQDSPYQEEAEHGTEYRVYRSRRHSTRASAQPGRNGGCECQGRVRRGRAECPPGGGAVRRHGLQRFLPAAVCAWRDGSGDRGAGDTVLHRKADPPFACDGFARGRGGEAKGPDYVRGIPVALQRRGSQGQRVPCRKAHQPRAWLVRRRAARCAVVAGQGDVWRADCGADHAHLRPCAVPCRPGAGGATLQARCRRCGPSPRRAR